LEKELAISIIKFGSKIQSIVNYFMLTNKIKSYWKPIFKSYLLKWEQEYTSALQMLLKSKECINDKFYYYFRKLSILSIYIITLKKQSRDEEIISLYNEIKENYDKIPKQLRFFAITLLRNVEINFIDKNNFKLTRVWSKDFEEDSIAKAYTMLKEAQFNAKSNIKEALKLYEETLSIILDNNLQYNNVYRRSLNDMSWYYRNLDIEKSTLYVNHLIIENVFESFRSKVDINELDTINTVVQLNYKIAIKNYYMLKLLFSKANNEISNETMSLFHFKSNSHDVEELLINDIKMIIGDNLTHAEQKYNVSRKSLSHILNGYANTIKSNTIQKIIKDVKISDINKFKSFAIKNEIIKKYINIIYNKKISFIDTYDKNVIKNQMILFYVLFGDILDIKYVEIKQIIENIGNYKFFDNIIDYDKKLFVINSINIHLYLRIMTLLSSNVTKKYIDKIFNNFMKLSKKDRDILKEFFYHYFILEIMQLSICKSVNKNIKIPKGFNRCNAYLALLMFNNIKTRERILNLLNQ
jgi:hypothetical protein